MKAVVYGVVGLIFFAGAGAGSWYVKTTYIDEPPVEEVDDGALTITFPKADLTPDEEVAEEGNGDLPIVERSPALTLDEIYMLSDKLAKRSDDVAEREEELERERARFKLVQQDLHTQEMKLESLQEDLKGKVEQLNAILAKALQAKQEAERVQAEAEDSMAALEPGGSNSAENEANNLGRVADLLKSMDSEKGAALLKNYANNGDLTTPAKLLNLIEARDASKLMGSLEDPVLIGQIAEAMLQLKHPSPKKKRR